MTRRALACLLAAAALLGPARAGPGEMRFRGTVERADGDQLTIRREGGSTLNIRMNPRTRVLAAAEGTVRQIKPESYVAVLSRSDAEPVRAEGVTLFSPSERGFEAGRQPWDGARLTAGWIGEIGGSGARRVVLVYEGGRSAFEIPDATRVTQVGPGEKAMLVPGARVTAITHAGGDGTPEAGVVVVGRLGVVPTL